MSGGWLALVLVALLGGAGAAWWRTARALGAERARSRQLAAQLATAEMQIEALVSAPPSMREQRRVLDRIRPNGPPVPEA